MVVEEIPDERFQCNVSLVESNTSRPPVKPPSYKKVYSCIIIGLQHFIVIMSDQLLRNPVLL